MRLLEFLDNVGHPWAYYPALATPLGGAKAALFLSAIAAWQDECCGPLGVSKSVDEIQRATALTATEQRTARKALRAAGVLIEVERRLEHKLYYRIDVVALLALIDRTRAIGVERRAR
ncbi:hypothetical protein [Caballeronia sp. LZ001]|uniref:hypothetical protein n=1 Tax=Caballeronia sp. LZ001 TaxID=3038553 RepID=UPI002858EFA1|nr:hypothetical protein [Caballeronia sp. LZ001]MDR5802581.1 hypothetical protein [Caballeronia sp. LZ001]